MWGDRDGVWGPHPGSDTDLRLLGVGRQRSVSPTLLRECLKQRRRKRRNCFLSSASYPKPPAPGQHLVKTSLRFRGWRLLNF